MVESVGFVQTVCIYHLLCRSLGEEVAIPEIVDLNVLNVVTVGGVHLAVEGWRWRITSWRGR